METLYFTKEHLWIRIEDTQKKYCEYRYKPLWTRKFWRISIC